MPQNSVSVRSGATALDVYAPGHLGELTEIIDPELVDAVLEDTGARQQRLRLLPARLVTRSTSSRRAGHRRPIRDALRSTRKRRPTVRRPLPDGSYLTAVLPRRYRARASGQRVQVRVVEAWLTVVLADGSHPADELLRLYHRRWQAETCYFSLKSTILDGRVLRSRSAPGLEQEIFALLTVYQALVRMAGDVTTATPGLSFQRVSFTLGGPGSPGTYRAAATVLGRAP
ncbi:transposase domain-containing protein [Streptomyces sp. NPDC057236]|uniref:transposase domain-containing protein n=1 Tax=Streptomyces sp. NPDC057236 TaxID=3346059 RepID=UPI00363BD332